MLVRSTSIKTIILYPNKVITDFSKEEVKVVDLINPIFKRGVK